MEYIQLLPSKNVSNIKIKCDLPHQLYLWEKLIYLPENLFWSVIQQFCDMKS